jgi:hypothetical protein
MSDISFDTISDMDSSISSAVSIKVQDPVDVRYHPTFYIKEDMIIIQVRMTISEGLQGSDLTHQGGQYTVSHSTIPAHEGLCLLFGRLG